MVEVNSNAESIPVAPRLCALDAVLLAALLALNAAILLIKGTERFEFFDMSAFLDAGYRVASGQEPYVDFYYTAGPIHLYMHALSFVLFGFTKTAVMVHLCSVGLLATVLVYVIARLYLAPILASLFAVLTIFSFYGPVCHPWYDQNASIWLFTAILLWEVRARFWPETVLDRVALACGALTGISFLTKSNVGLAGGFLFLLLFLNGPRKIRSLTAFTLGGALSLALVLLLILKKPSFFIEQNFFAYAPTERLTNFARLGEALVMTPALLILAGAITITALGGKTFLLQNRARLAMLAGLIMAGIFTAWTSSMDIRANRVWAGFQFLNLALLARELPPQCFERFAQSQARVKGALWCGIALLAVFNLKSAAECTADGIAWAWNPTVLRSDYLIQTESFRGWRCNGKIGAGMDKTVEYITKNVPPNESLFVFPDVTMIYGLTGRDSYRKTPFIFHQNQILRGRWYDEFREHFLSEPPQWWVLHDLKRHPQPDLTARPLLAWLKLAEFMNQKYRVVWHEGDFYILQLQPATPAKQ